MKYLPAKASMMLTALLVLSAIAVQSASGAACGPPPSGSGGNWFRAYQAWCRQCGGTPSLNASPATCTPGPNWGKGSAASGTKGSAGNLATGITNMFDQERDRAYQENAEMMRSMDASSRERIREEDERAREAAEKVKLSAEQQRQEVLSSMKGANPAGLPASRTPVGEDLTLKPGTKLFGIPGNPDGLVMKEIDASTEPRITGKTPSLLRGKEERGNRVIDCKSSIAARQRIAKGLPVQKAAIDRTAAHIEEAKRTRQAASAEARDAILASARDELISAGKDFLTTTKMLRMRIASMKAEGLSDKDRRAWLRTMDALYDAGTEGIGNIESVANAGKAGYDYGKHIQAGIGTFSAQVSRLNRFLLESGITETVEESLSETVGGPLGALAFRMAKLSLDVGAATAQGVISRDEQLRAVENLNVMRHQYRRANDDIRALDEDIAQYCR